MIVKQYLGGRNIFFNDLQCKSLKKNFTHSLSYRYQTGYRSQSFIREWYLEIKENPAMGSHQPQRLSTCWLSSHYYNNTWVLRTDRYLNTWQSSQNCFCGSKSCYNRCLKNHMLPWWETHTMWVAAGHHYGWVIIKLDKLFGRLLN